MNKTGRLISLDAARGFTIVAMITVNHPGSWEHVYAQLRHKDWNGITFTDLIFPFFLFFVGVSIALAYTKRLESNAPRSDMYKKIVTRSAKIFAVGIFLNVLHPVLLYPDFSFSDIRVAGVLQRIALVFLACAFLFLYCNWKTQAWIGTATLLTYWLAMSLIPTPGEGKPMLEPGVNLAAWIDSILLPGKMWKGTWDPEGLFSTLPAIVTGITGMLAGKLLLSKISQQEKVNYLLLSGFFAVIIGSIWGTIFPLNKNLWTSSYVLVTSGIASVTLGIIYYALDISGKIKIARPGIVIGANSITVYVLAAFLAIIFYNIPFFGQNLNNHFFNAFTGIGLPFKLVSLMYAIIFICVNYIPAYVLYRQKIFIKL
ncbi:MAG: heparan-alpha-glucosaminide N-acetyltransferase domain-containing protein [Candidatus Marinimicrobia bacterium]|jgi:predicted acyltransferase|nr:heparan-alpha-glucosaminide N-acetyltransferase domain-containing protein [Candidatus Neomarinimicrobiota bacterium]|tara:strand:- start:2831 stop:3943 length:1113 start_codon:yes stop_codon:yes gene_type:complete